MMRTFFFDQAWPGRLALVAALILLAGCSSSHQDINQWMDEQRRAATPRVTPLKVPQPFVPETYTESSAPDPFSSARLTQALRSQNAGSDALLRAELNRRKEPLEAFPLDAMSMVGSIAQQGHKVALIKVNNLIYQVAVGNYLGQDYGKVTKITENAVELHEIVQNSSDEWIERNTVMQLQESQEKSK